MNLQLASKTFVWLLVLTLSLRPAMAQTGFFVPVSSASARVAIPPIAQSIAHSTLYQLNTSSLRTYLDKAPLEFTGNGTPLQLALPLPDGTVESFTIFESPILAPAVAAQHPEIKTYTGRGLSHPGYTVRLSFTSSGFDAIILGVGNNAIYYTKTAANDPTDQLYLLYSARDVKKNDSAGASASVGQCGNTGPAIDIQSVAPGKSERQAATLNNTGATLRTFRLAVGANAEFVQKRGGTVQAAFNSIVGYVNRMNAVYRTELSVAFSLVSGTNTVYTDTAKYTNSNQSKLLDQNQANLDAVIGNANYDVGHVFGYGGGSGGGVAVTPSVCVNDRKAKGVSRMGNTSYGPIDPKFGSYAPVYDDQLISHEVGHQFSMTHSFNSVIPVCTTREATTSVEPGAGTTIMSYGYTCENTDLSRGPVGNDDYEATYQPFLNFHTVNYDQGTNYITGLTCFSSTALNNAVPVINTFPANVTIPKSTPFELTGTATDANSGDVLSYSWEGTNIGTVVPTASTLLDTSQPPFFRSYQPVPTGTRTFPRLSAILDGTNTARGDKLPSVGIVTTHRLTVRDNVGGLTYREAAVTIDGNSGPFLETTNLTGSFQGSTQRTITWSVANTTAAPVNCAAVNILLSTDGGLTFPTMLLTNTPNDGTEPVTFPNITTNQARIKVVAANNIFFDISNSNFTIVDPNNKPPVAPAIASQAATLDVPFSFVVPAFTDPENQTLSYAATGLPSSLTFNPATRVISGTPTALGASTVNIVATDPASATASATFTLTVNPPAAIPLAVSLVASSLTVATTGAVTLTAVITGGRPAYTYSFRGPSVAISTSGNSCTLTQFDAGVNSVTVTVTDNTLPVSQTATATISVTATTPNVPTVLVNSTDPNAAEGRPTASAGGRIGVQSKEDVTADTDNDDPGFIHFQRNNGQGTLVVNYQIGGTATNGVDFISLPTSVTFADGQTEIIEEMDPIDDDLVEGDETVIITLIPEPTYNPDPTQNTTTLTIHDAPSSLTITSFTCNTTNSVLSSVNFVVGYAGGSFVPAVSPLFINGVTNNGQLGVSYTARFDANGSTITVQDQANRRSTYFVWNFRQACATAVPTPTPTPSSLTITSFTCNTTNSVLSSVNFVVGYTSGGFTPAVAPLFINGVTTSGQLGVSYTLPFDRNANTLTVQDQASRSTYLVWNFRQACATAVPTPTPTPSTLAITSFTCNTTNSVLSSVNFVVGYTSGGFTPAVAPLFINGVTASGQLGVSYTLPFDRNVNTLTVQDQASRSTYFVWNFRQACANASLRVGDEETTPWQVSVLGNPPVTDYAEVVVKNAKGLALVLNVVDMAGYDVSTKSVSVTDVAQQVRVHLGHPGGMYLLKVSDGIRQQTLRILRP